MPMNNDLHFSSMSNEWETPDVFYNKLNDEFNFTLDPCSSINNHKCEKYYTIEDNGLEKNWSNEIVFMNPPYGREIGAWIKKAYEEYTNNGVTVVCLIPARTDTIYWHQYIFNVATEIRFLKGRLKFELNGAPIVSGNGKSSPAPFPSAVIVYKQENI
jgi:site-specific DNA-methyltransferase (adenine-specific)